MPLLAETVDFFGDRIYSTANFDPAGSRFQTLLRRNILGLTN